MRGIRFYEEFQDIDNGISGGNCVAIFVETGGIWLDGKPTGYIFDCLAATFSHANSDVSTTTVHINYLRNSCKRISEKRAREIHQRLFDRLDMED